MYKTEDRYRLLSFMDDLVVVLDQNGLARFKNAQAQSLFPKTMLVLDGDVKKSLQEFICQNQVKTKESFTFSNVQIVHEKFRNLFYQVSICFDEEYLEWYCFFKNVSHSVQLESQLKKNESEIQLHIQELTLANTELKRQNEMIQLAQEDIQSGLRYGKIIQDRINASCDKVKALFPKSFTYYKPQNQIGGDLIWVNECSLGKIIAVIDCMGHGVPGAMLAMSVYHILNTTLENGEFESVTEFLCNLAQEYHRSFFKNKTKSEFADTFDISMCIVDESSNLIRFRGIKRPLIIERDQRLVEFKGERVSVAHPNAEKLLKEEPWDKVWPYKPGDHVYLFTDGYPDQFGGAKNKKYKYRKFKDLIRSVSSKDIEFQRKTIEDDLYNWQNYLGRSYDQTDDIALVGVQF